MSTDNLKQSLKNLHAQLETAGDADPELRELLQTLENDIQNLLVREAAADGKPDSGLLERVQAISAKFAVRHPHMEPALRELADILGRMGI